MKIFIGFSICIWVLMLFACRKPYNPTVTTINSNILVVEGFIDAGADSTIFKLSRTQIISNKNKNNPEIGAVLTIESNSNESFQLPEISKGKYASPKLNLSSDKKYRLRIKTAKQVNYLSDFVMVKTSPPIDSLNYKVEETGVRIFVNTHDPSNNSRYYKWDFTETWQFFSGFYSTLKWNGLTAEPRDMVNDNISTCWVSNSVHPVALGSSVKLAQDVMYQNPLTSVSAQSEKLSYKYSILVKQYVLTKEAYEFWENLKKNTENLGSIFDAQPSYVSGNIYNIADGAEPVLGYVSAGTVQQKRLFILKSDLPKWKSQSPYDFCITPDTIYTKDYKVHFEAGYNVPLYEVYNFNGTAVIGVGAGSTTCTDCTLRGTNKRPAYWQ